MPELILHHYPLSPFSEKLRVMLGYAGLSWQSVITREMPPRPRLEALAGGYRKVPVAQIGADVFCDTRTIASEIATLSVRPELGLENCSAEVREFAAMADLEVFLACVMVGGAGKITQRVREAMSLPDVLRFAWDRIGIGLRAKVKGVGIRGARPRVLRHLAEVEGRLQQRDFLFGPRPNHADFSTYHSLWFIRDMGGSSLIDAFPRTLAWMDRMKAFGHGEPRQISAQQALDVARAAEPRAIAPEHRQDALIGSKVRVAPTDYGQDPTIGILVGATPERWILMREPQGGGRLHVHLPKADFELKVV
ncbi:glutathione S-transferase family protein [Solimonas sp. SE-A11]|uniref:glutathione S-transferase family protein n=1 Tax=Solimonas sp. SE-A11 TaxID=3054954 RepID=UPI00259C9115|nr:glutathione S-transferase family protein [Solimonas sp. SE-A11]MDM4768700.1 glutathione S-transferase family protein [Solimonas sp. SE-A11]